MNITKSERMFAVICPECFEPAGLALEGGTLFSTLDDDPDMTRLMHKLSLLGWCPYYEQVCPQCEAAFGPSEAVVHTEHLVIPECCMCAKRAPNLHTVGVRFFCSVCLSYIVKAGGQLLSTPPQQGDPPDGLDITDLDRSAHRDPDDSNGVPAEAGSGPKPALRAMRRGGVSGLGSKAVGPITGKKAR